MNILIFYKRALMVLFSVLIIITGIQFILLKQFERRTTEALDLTRQAIDQATAAQKTLEECVEAYMSTKNAAPATTTPISL